MSVRRMRVPLSGESLRSLSTTGRGAAGSSRDSRAMGDWQKEQREWEERADAVTEMVEGAEVKDTDGGRGETGEINHNGNDNFNDNRGVEAITGDRNLSWETGDDVGGFGADSRGKGQKFFAWVLTWKVRTAQEP